MVDVSSPASPTRLDHPAGSRCPIISVLDDWRRRGMDGVDARSRGVRLRRGASSSFSTCRPERRRLAFYRSLLCNHELVLRKPESDRDRVECGGSRQEPARDRDPRLEMRKAVGRRSPRARARRSRRATSSTRPGRLPFERRGPVERRLRPPSPRGVPRHDSRSSENQDRQGAASRDGPRTHGARASVAGLVLWFGGDDRLFAGSLASGGRTPRSSRTSNARSTSGRGGRPLQRSFATPVAAVPAHPHRNMPRAAATIDDPGDCRRDRRCHRPSAA